MPEGLDLIHTCEHASTVQHDVADLEILQLRVDPRRRMLSFHVTGATKQPLDPVVRVEPRPLDPHLHDPGPHPLRRRPDRDRPRAPDLRMPSPVIARKGVGGLLLGRSPPQHQRPPGQVARHPSCHHHPPADSPCGRDPWPPPCFTPAVRRPQQEDQRPLPTCSLRAECPLWRGTDSQGLTTGPPPITAVHVRAEIAVRHRLVLASAAAGSSVRRLRSSDGAFPAGTPVSGRRLRRRRRRCKWRAGPAAAPSAARNTGAPVRSPMARSIARAVRGASRW
jgi:hypothetical protein